MDTLVQGRNLPQNSIFQINPSFDEFSLSQIDESCAVSDEGESGKETDHSDAILKFISQMLMEEEDLENKPCMLHDCLALQATEKSLYDVLNNRHENPQSPNDHFANWSPEMISPPDRAPTNYREKKNRHREGTDSLEEDRRSNKQSANNLDESDDSDSAFDMYDKVLLCSNSDHAPARAQATRRPNENRGRPKGGRKHSLGVKEVVDLRSLLLQCAQAVGSFDARTVTDLLVRIRQHSSPHGDGMERLAHYFANALEARLAGTGTATYAAISSVRISAADILKAYKTYITACPFKKMSNLLANKTIKKLAAGAATLHIIDFGILYGYQWPCLIQSLSELPGGPPKLRITGIDFPQPGFRPAERVEATGRRLANYCDRFKVQFEFVPVAQKWETIKLEDLRIQRDSGEVLVVNSLYRLHNIPDETVMAHSPRDTLLSLIKMINPDMFIHGVINGTYNTPFFITRFREAMFHYSSLFDMFEATVGREDRERMLFEEQVFGKEAMNIIACEGTERVERPETYKQWQARNVRAGFREVAMDRDVVEYVRKKVRKEYDKDFSVDEDGKWMLQGWKGRVLFAMSCWKP